MKKLFYTTFLSFFGGFTVFISSCQTPNKSTQDLETTTISMSKATFHDKMKGAWTGQVIGVTYGFGSLEELTLHQPDFIANNCE